MRISLHDSLVMICLVRRHLRSKSQESDSRGESEADSAMVGWMVGQVRDTKREKNGAGALKRKIGGELSIFSVPNMDIKRSTSR